MLTYRVTHSTIRLGRRAVKWIVRSANQANNAGAKIITPRASRIHHVRQTDQYEAEFGIAIVLAAPTVAPKIVLANAEKQANPKTLVIRQYDLRGNGWSGE